MTLIGRIQAVVEHIATIVKGKQDTLVSGRNLKTINGESLLGSGNLPVSGGSTIIEVEIDLGSDRTKGTTLEIVDTNVAVSNKIQAWIGGIVDRPNDELACASISIVSIPGDEAFTIMISSSEYITGKYILYYIIS